MALCTVKTKQIDLTALLPGIFFEFSIVCWRSYIEKHYITAWWTQLHNEREFVILKVKEKKPFLWKCQPLPYYDCVNSQDLAYSRPQNYIFMKAQFTFSLKCAYFLLKLVPIQKSQSPGISRDFSEKVSEVSGCSSPGILKTLIRAFCKAIITIRFSGKGAICAFCVTLRQVYFFLFWVP